MSGSDDLLARRAAGTLRSPEGAPRLLALPGDLLTPITAPDAKGAAAFVRHQAEHGTDSNGASWVIPGLGLHDEFALLAEAGVSAATILRAATSDAARFFGREARAGAVRAGFEADLVLLGGDPTADAAALADVRGVVRDGAYRDRAALDETLDRLASHPTVR